MGAWARGGAGGGERGGLDGLGHPHSRDAAEDPAEQRGAGLPKDK